MIPQRTANTELFGNGLKSRVTACRKRLRTHRVTEKPSACRELDEALEAADDAPFPADSPAVRQSLNEISNFRSHISNQSPELTSGGCDSVERLFEGQEAGIP